MDILDDQFELRLASGSDDLNAVQRLRYEVFVEELGASGENIDHARRIETDRFDEFADHLMLIDHRKSGQDALAGVYRLMRAEHAVRAGGFYSETEYDLGPLLQSGRRLLELGRSCLAPDYRGGTAMLQLWQGLAGYVQDHGIEILFGTASFRGTDTAALAAPLSLLHHEFLAPERLRPIARHPGRQAMNLLPPDAIDRPRAMRATPALIKAYLRLGGTVGDGAYTDHAFNCTDICLVLDTAQMSQKYRAIYDAKRA